MNHRFCHRCQTELPPHDEGALFFCSHCGAAQVLLSEELLLQIETQSREALDNVDPSPAPRDPRSLVWAGALRCAALAGAVAAGLACLSIVLPPAFLLTMLWMVISPVVVLGLFQARFPMAPITTGFGSRLGLLTGISVASTLSVVTTISLLVARFHFKTMVEFDKLWAAQIDQQAHILAQSGTDVSLVMKMSSLPEFRAGMMLLGLAMSIVMLLVITTAGGAFAGFVRSRPRV